MVDFAKLNRVHRTAKRVCKNLCAEYFVTPNSQTNDVSGSDCMDMMVKAFKDGFRKGEKEAKK